jgi:hypothetical protein
MLDWILALLNLLPRDAESAKRVERISSRVGDRLRPWIYGLIAVTIAFLVVVFVFLLVAG